MRLKITYKPKNYGLLLPLHYNYSIAALLYKTFSENVAEILHTKGFILEKRHFKLFTFSRILDKGEKVESDKLKKLKSAFGINKDFVFRNRRANAPETALFFKNKVSFYFSSVKQFIVEDVGTRILTLPSFDLLGQEILLSSLEVLKEPKITDNTLIKMLSPVTVYSTMKTEDGKVKTYYYSPNEKEFKELVKNNAIKKYTVTYGRHPLKETLDISTYYFNEKRNRAVVYFKGTRIEGWTGIFQLKGNPELIKIVYDTGIGAKNSNGFGMWKIYKP